jgi:acetyl-CoA carboxylase carboxyltransferase component
VGASEQKADQYRRRRHDLTQGGSAVARRRIDGLVDRGSFVELDLFAGDGVVGGFGTVDAREVAVYAQGPSVLGGSPGEMTARKIVKVQELALRSRIPIVGIHDPSGARMPDGVPALAGYADVFFRHVRSSGVLPQISVIAGPSSGEAIPAPMLTDFVFVVAGSGEGAHFLPQTEDECWEGVRELLSYLPSSSAEQPSRRATTDSSERADPELQSLVPDSPDLSFDMREVMNRVLDDSRFLEVQPFFARNVVAGFGRLGGHPVGVVGNQPKVLAGAIDADASAKAARFIRFCDAFNVPVVSLVDAPGTSGDLGEITGHGAKLLYAYAEAVVPKLTVVTRRDHGGAYWLMSPKQTGADLNLAWPTAEIAATGREGLELAAERGYIDEVIEPKETRRQLIHGLELCLRKQVDRPTRKHGNIPL